MAQTAYEIPLSPQPQVFNIQLAGVTYWLTVRWNGFSQNWSLDIADADRIPLLAGIPIVTGLDLLSQFGYMLFGGMLIAQTDFNTDAVPTYENLGIGGRLYFVVED